jgi:hypothetical protein
MERVLREEMISWATAISLTISSFSQEKCIVFSL